MYRVNGPKHKSSPLAKHCDGSTVTRTHQSPETDKQSSGCVSIVGTTVTSFAERRTREPLNDLCLCWDPNRLANRLHGVCVCVCVHTSLIDNADTNRTECWTSSGTHTNERQKTPKHSNSAVKQLLCLIKIPTAHCNTSGLGWCRKSPSQIYHRSCITSSVLVE